MSHNFPRTCSVIALILCVAGRGVPAEPLPVSTNSLGMEMAAVPAGSFTMGEDYDGDWDERPAHQITISRPFQISVSEVTLEQYRHFRPQHDCAFNGKATGVSWYDAVTFCAWLSQKERKPYRLPTEAEWEYAARAGTTNRFWSGHTPPANHDEANPWGLRGVHDAVMEWCHDWHGPYSANQQTDPVGPASGIARVVRGDKPDMDDRLKDEKGRQAVDYHRSANRAALPPRFGVLDTHGSNSGCHRVGFRVVQAEMPRTEPIPVFPPFIRQGIKLPITHLKQAPDKPYFRKRHLLPIPPDNSPDEAIVAAGFPPSFRKHNHSPALEVCPNGDLLLSLYTSYFEYEPGVSFIATRLRFGADLWDFPEPIFDTPDANDHAPLLWTDSTSARIWFFWGWPKLRAGAYPFQWITSRDSGATWTEVHFPRFIHPPGPHSRQPINTALRSADGTIYVASDAEKATSVLWATKDEGITWYDTGGRTAGRHTTFASLPDGSILGLGGKSSDIDGYMPEVVSRDGGKSWQTNRSPFAAQGVNQRPSLLRLQSGRLLFAADFQRRGNTAPKEITDRGSYVALSDDDARTWRIKKLPGAQPHERPELQKEPSTLGYTAARQAPNGMIHLVTTMNTPCLHFEFNEAWILSVGPVPSPGAAPELMESRATKVPKVETFTAKFPNGEIQFRWSGGVADDGRFLKHGDEKWYYPNGKLHYEATFHLGRKQDSETLYRPDGAPAWRWQQKSDGTSIWTQFREDGKSESTWRGSTAHGKSRTWDRSGRLLSEVNFADGRLN